MPVSELGGGGVEIRILGAEINSSGLLQIRVRIQKRRMILRTGASPSFSMGMSQKSSYWGGPRMAITGSMFARQEYLDLGRDWGRRF